VRSDASTSTAITPAPGRARRPIPAALRRGAVPILMYHQVAPAHPAGVKPSLLVTPEAFAAQMRWLHRLGWRTLRLDDLLTLLETTAIIPRRRFILTFDDAFLGVAQHAVPVLNNLGFTATIFVPTGLVGTHQALDGGPDHPAKALMGWDHLRALLAAGFDIGAHTRSHPHLPRLTDGEVRAEVAGSRADIEEALGVRPSTFAYPYGHWRPEVAAVVRESGFRGACTTRFGRTDVSSAPFILPRISVGSDLDLMHFAYRLAFADRVARRVARQAGTEGRLS